ncbi:MAG: hypothetical protein RR585_12115 [Coprobacillus sp.]
MEDKKIEEVVKEKKSIFKEIVELSPVKKRKLLTWFLSILIIGGVYIGYTNYKLYTDKTAEETYWQAGLKDNPELLKEADQYKNTATVVTTGTYLENLKEVNVKASNFRVVFSCWFRWDGDEKLDMANNFRVYNGVINKKEVLEDYHKGNTHYQQVRVDATVQKNYWIVRFPLESYQLRFFIEPSYSVERVRIEADTQYSSVNKNLNISGFEYKRSAVSTYTMKYNSNLGNPESSVPISQELATSIEINRDGFGLYLKCFIALIGTLTWVFITLYLCTFHNIDPLSMIPAALFGTVTNIMVGANLLPDALQIGLLEYVTLAGIMVILACSISVVNVNRIRTKMKDSRFAYLFGQTMFFTILTLTLLATVLYPVCSFMF